MSAYGGENSETVRFAVSWNVVILQVSEMVALEEREC